MALGYSPIELGLAPPSANLGTACGNPVMLADLRPGEVVLDVGCGAGLDVILAARRVGPGGRAIGVDMTPAMIALARKNISRCRDEVRSCAEFRVGRAERLPLPSESVDCVLSNCTLNLVAY